VKFDGEVAGHVAPQNARSRRTRAALLASARELAEREGLPALTMATVAERAGVTRRAVYLHFPSRADLVAALYEYVVETEELDASLKQVWQAPDAVTALDEWAGHLSRCHVALIPFGRAFQRVHGADPDATHSWDLVLRDWQRSCRRLVRWLAKEEQLAPQWTVESAADMLWALMSLDLLERLAVERGWSRKRLAKRLALLYQSTFVPAEPAPVRGAKKDRRNAS
jgi:AcrR family transcriptional regulator